MVNITSTMETELADLAKQHPSWESFLQDMERIGDHVWHKVRSESPDTQSTLDNGSSDVPSEMLAQPGTPGTPGTPGSPPTVSEDFVGDEAPTTSGSRAKK